MDIEKRKRDWESATYCGLMLGLRGVKNHFTNIDRHHVLNVKSREIDMIISSKADLSDLDNAVACFFKERNIIELKNPFEELTFDTVCNVGSYGLQYKASGRTVDEIKISEITLTILRVSRPREAFKKLQEAGCFIEQKYPGVYYVTGLTLLPMQIIVGNELEGDKFLALRVLKKNARKEDLQKFLAFSDNLKEQGEKEMADAVLQISITENKKAYYELMKEEETMSDAMIELMEEIMEPKIKVRLDKVKAEEHVNTCEEMATRMLQNNEPVSKVEKYTSVAKDRIVEIAQSIGVKPIVS